MTHDIFPPPNLSDLATPWARAHDSRVLKAEESLQALQESVAGQNRNTASSLQEISRLLEGLRKTVDLIPISKTVSARNSSFTPTAALTDPDWTPVCSASIGVPPGSQEMAALCVSSIRVYTPPALNVTLVRGRLVLRRIGGGYRFDGASIDAPRVDSPFGHYFTLSPFLGETFTPHPNGYTITLEVASNGGAVPEDPLNFGQLAMTTTFTKSPS